MESGVEQRQMLVEKVLNPIRIESSHVRRKFCDSEMVIRPTQTTVRHEFCSVGPQYLSLFVVVNSDINYLREFLLSLILNLILIEFS